VREHARRGLGGGGGEGDEGESSAHMVLRAIDPAGNLRSVRRVVLLAVQTAVSFALLAPVALAVEDHGEGLYGETNDKVVTNAGFILIGFFPLLILILSLLQWRLDRRKDLRKAAAKSRVDVDWHGGW
jgi:hypothetical protein